MLPSIIERRLAEHEAVAYNLRSVASELTATPAAAARLLQAAQTIDELVRLVRAQTYVAKLNHDVIVGRAG